MHRWYYEIINAFNSSVNLDFFIAKNSRRKFFHKYVESNFTNDILKVAILLVLCISHKRVLFSAISPQGLIVGRKEFSAILFYNKFPTIFIRTFFFYNP